MKTYKNDDLGFEIDIPDDWSYPTLLSPDCVLIYRTNIESINIIVGPIQPERLLEFTKNEFKQLAYRNNYTDLEFGKIFIEKKQHVWARYLMPSGLHTKKYLIMLGGIEYAITATCSNKDVLVEAEKGWDHIVKSFRLMEWRRKNLLVLDTRRKNIAGEMYVKGYEAASKGNYPEACKLLEQCLNDDPNHILAHKELAFILKNTGDVIGALPHRIRVKELDPSDVINRFNLAGIYAMLGKKEEAIHEMDELIRKEPSNQKYKDFRRMIIDFSP